VGSRQQAQPGVARVNERIDPRRHRVARGSRCRAVIGEPAERGAFVVGVLDRRTSKGALRRRDAAP